MENNSITREISSQQYKKHKHMKQNTAYIVPHTHWDREWRYPLWKNRMLLVEFMDQLLDILETNAAYKYFHLDGQSVIIDDYLQVRPDKKELVVKHVKSGRLGIGPWYTLPDLYPVNGECLVRNISKGIDTSNKYGGYPKVAYHSFGWGQISQFPQIYNDLGFELLFAGKRVSKERAPKSEFAWEGPDGSRVITSRFGEHSRANLFFNAYIAIKNGVNYFSPEYRYTWGESKQAIHDASPENQNTDYFIIDPDKEKWYPEKVKEGFLKAWKGYEKTHLQDDRLLMNGSDFSTPQPLLPDIIEQANKVIGDIEFKHANFTEYLNIIKEKLDDKNIPVVKGEMRDDGPADASANALATRMYLKLLNKKAENLLLYRAEPLAALLMAEGEEYPSEFFDIAWEYMLKSHTHDSINGVTQDKTANDVEYRLHQVIEITRVCIEKSIAVLARKLDLSLFEKDDVLLLCTNTSAIPASDILKAIVDIPREKNIWDFEFMDSGGEILPVQSIHRKERTTPVHDLENRALPLYHDRHEVYLDTGNIPAGGYKILKLVPKKTFPREGEWWPVARESSGREISKSPSEMENEHLKVSFNHDGTLNLLHKQSGNSFTNLHYFIDEGDMGDYWVHYPHYHNQIIDSRMATHRGWLAENGELAATYVVETTLLVPARGYRSNKGIEGESRRSSNLVELKLLSSFTLKKHDEKLLVKTKVKNTAKDHRLRLVLPTGIDATESIAGGHFSIEKRNVVQPGDETGKFYPEMQTKPMQQFVHVGNKKAGFTVLTNSFTEYELTRAEGILALTLYRSVENRICTEFRSSGYFPEQEGGQSLRYMEFEYALYPVKSDMADSKLAAEARAFNSPPFIYQVTPGKNGTLSPSSSFFSLEPSELIITALKKCNSRDSIIIRLYNPSGETTKGKIKFGRNITGAYKTNLVEERKHKLEHETRQMEIVLDKHKIETYEVILDK